MATTESLINPDEDGITHINVYSKGKTTLGQLLSNFAHTPFSCDDGHFESVEGYWYWLGTDHPQKDILRNLHGWKAKQEGRDLRSLDYQEENPDFINKIKEAINAKLMTHEDILTGLVMSELPLKHYYNYGGKVVEPKSGLWILEHFEWIRKTVKPKIIA